MSENLPQQYQEPAPLLSSTTSLVLDPMAMQNMMALADIMSKAVATVPAHFRGKPGDCLAVVMQAMQWGMNPYAIAQKTHLTQGGQLGYEAQLISAVITGSGALVTQPEYEFLGDWSKILGKVAERTSDKGGKYYVANWKPADEEGLGVVVRARLRNEQEPRSLTVMMSQAYPRFSTQWATDPQQQITYLAIRKFGRRYAPGAILGVYTPDELDDVPPSGAERATADDKRNVVDQAAIDKQAAERARAEALRDKLETAASQGAAAVAVVWKHASVDDRKLLDGQTWAEAKRRAASIDEAKKAAADAPKPPTYAQIMQSINESADAAALAEALGVDMAHLTPQMQGELIDAGKAKAAAMGAEA